MKLHAPAALRVPALRRQLGRQWQSGATAVELALIMLLAFLPLLFGIIEMSRLFYVANVTQEVTRRAARAQVVRWESQADAIRRDAVLQCADRNGMSRVTIDCRTTAATVNLPGSPETNNARVELRFFHSFENARTGNLPITGVASPQDNLNTCLLNPDDTNCIRFVRATLIDLEYRPMIGFLGDVFRIPLSDATVIMPAESLGLL